MIELDDFLKPLLPDGWTLTQHELFRIDDHLGKVQWTLFSFQEIDQRLEMIYNSASLELHVHLSRLTHHRAVIAGMELRNISEANVFINRIEPLLLEWHAPCDAVYMRCCGGGTNEHHYPPETFKNKTVRADQDGFLWIENGFDGRSSNFHLPIMAVCSGDSGVSAGLEWSGLWWMYGKGNPEDRQAISCHIPVKQLRLDPGEILQLPNAHYVFSDGGLDGAGNAMRSYIRDCLTPRCGEKHLQAQCTYNHWFGIGPAINEAVFKKQCLRAKELGFNYVILDAGWYAGCSETDFSSGVGNWQRIDSEKFPNGLEALSTCAQEQDLAFGLWFEVERAHRDSDWATQHPDWYMDTGGNYLHLNMGNDAAVDACIQLVQDAIDRYHCRWLKLDYNIGPKAFWEHADPSGKIQFQYMRGLYRFFETLRLNNPDVILENCASGGRRIDLGTIAQTHVQNLTDQTSSAEICRYTMHGAHTFLPASICPIGIPFGHAEAHGVSNLNSYQLACRMSGLPIAYGDIASLSENDQALLASFIAFHRRFSSIFCGDFFRLTAQACDDRAVEAVAHLSADRSNGLVLIFGGHEAAATDTCLDFSSVRRLHNYTLEELPLPGQTVHGLLKNGQISIGDLKNALLPVCIGARQAAALQLRI